MSDPGGLLDLPRGFRYRVISAEESFLTNGQTVPGDFDGMAAYPGPDRNSVYLVRNHELRPGDENPVEGKNPYQRSQPGGTSGILVAGAERRAVKDFITSSGSRNNCAGGPTPWGTWLTCEEDRTTNHGYVFEVDPRDPENDLSRTPIRAMGFFSHEAVAVDPDTGIVYLTEDDFRGTITDDPKQETRSSFFYRYTPNNRAQRPGALQEGGTLEALAIEERPGWNADFFSQRQRFGVVWRRVEAADAAASALAQGCVRFNRLEGAEFAGGAVWFDDTAGGEERLGQVFRFLPATNTLELFYEGTQASQMESPDNVTVTPWGDLWFCEDGDNGNRLMGITPERQVYRFATNRLSLSELAGPCFSPSGRTFFVNIQSPGLTFAIWGPFPRRDAAGARRMAAAAPPQGIGPSVSPELDEAADRHGLTQLEVAAYERLGVPVA